MIDRVGTFTVSLGHADRAARGTDRAGRAGEFEDLMRGAAEQAEPAPSSPLRLTRVGARTREAGQPSAAARTTPEATTPEAAASEATASEPTPTPTASGPASSSPETPTPAAAPGTHFVRSADTTAPHLPRFAQVPESAQFPQGPYRQAPAEFGGDWWLVNPFTGSEPWRALDFADAPNVALETEPAPEDFVRVFGPRPDTSTAAAQWEQDLTYFQGTGLPDGFDNTQLDAATAQFEAWGMGKPVFYEGRYGWQVRFPDSQLPTFETTASTALLVPHLVVAEFQVREIQEGISPGPLHPFLPERLRA
jgi:hypothetical protein